MIANLVMDEANGFLARHSDIQGDFAQAVGGLTWGLMRAYYESPCHPGVVMNPADPAGLPEGTPAGDWWYCPTCCLAYRYRSDEEIAANKAKGGRK